jgi:hypothetical protein
MAGFISDLFEQGTTEPLEPKTLPKRVVMNFVALHYSLWSFNCRIAHIFWSFTRPSRYLVALSVETMTNFTTLCSQAKSAKFLVPSILSEWPATGFLPSTAHACMQRGNVGFVQFEHFTQCSLFLISALRCIFCTWNNTFRL